MSKKRKSIETAKALTTAEFETRFDDGEDISDQLEMASARVFAPGEFLDLTPTKVNVDFPKWMVVGLDGAANRVGVPRQSLIKLWLSERLEEVAAASNKRRQRTASVPSAGNNPR